jgi:AAA+ ATPase superfamily predicted ATPase
MKNPFKYGSRVCGNAFFDRAKIMRDMLCVVDGGNNAVLYGPRRYGKTSLLDAWAWGAI